MDSIIELLNEIRMLMELKGENHFKLRAFEKAAQNFAESQEGSSGLLARARAGTLTELPGIGKGIAAVISEYLLEGHSSVRDELKRSLPAGLLELTEIPGLGPKKARVLIEQLEIQTIGELEYACKENRLLNLKGFGLKIQKKILEEVMFKNSNRGFCKLADVDAFAEQILRGLQASCEGRRVIETGALRRKAEVLSELEFLIETSSEGQNGKAQVFAEKHSGPLPIRLHFTSPNRFGYDLAKTTGSVSHWEALGDPKYFDASTEEVFYQQLGLPHLPPETRETGEEVQLAREGSFPKLLPWDGIRGVFHNHTTRSDGTASLEQMVTKAENLGYEYIGISDHSQSAFYAQGLKEAELLEQENEVREVQSRHPKIRIFWGIESDILADGSLDYGEEVLRRFDFVIASIHSRMNMDKTQMTDRILRAIRNPFTRFVGHLTGRLLLGRRGYELDVEPIVAEAARCQVAIELNSNPARLDLDWRLGPVMRKSGTWTSINPDAHDIQGLSDIRYGITMARKGLLPVERVLNVKSKEEVEKWLRRA